MILQEKSAWHNEGIPAEEIYQVAVALKSQRQNGPFGTLEEESGTKNHCCLLALLKI